MNTFPKSTVGSQYFTLTEIKVNTRNAPPLATFIGWMTHVRGDRLTRGSNKTQFNLFFGKLDHLFFNLARLWWPEVTPFFAHSAKKGRKWSLRKLPSRSQVPPPPPLGGILAGTKLRHKKRLLSSGRSSIRQSWLVCDAV